MKFSMNPFLLPGSRATHHDIREAKKSNNKQFD
jgi:hypothetical protein